MVVRRLPDPPVELRIASALAAGPDRVLVVDPQSTSAWMLDLRGPEWRPCSTSEVIVPQLTFPDGSVWCAGDAGRSWLLDPVTELWHALPEGPHVAHAITCLLDDNEALVVGGFGAHARSSWRGDPRTGVWSPAAPITPNRLAPGRALVTTFGEQEHSAGGPRVLVAGWNNWPDQHQSERVDVYDPAADRWSGLSCPSARALSRPGGWEAPSPFSGLVESAWGVVEDVMLCGNIVVAAIGERFNQEVSWSHHRVRTLALFDPVGVAWMGEVKTPKNSMVGPGVAAAGGVLLGAGWHHLDVWDGHRWTKVPWGENVHVAAVAVVGLDGGRAVVVGRTSAFLVEPEADDASVLVWA